MISDKNDNSKIDEQSATKYPKQRKPLQNKLKNTVLYIDTKASVARSSKSVTSKLYNNENKQTR
jgi:hypothetical protein